MHVGGRQSFSVDPVSFFMRRRKKLASLLPRRTTDTATNTRDTVDGQ